MPALGETLRVEGLADLQRAFYVADRSLSRELKTGLREVAEPVKTGAEILALARIRRMDARWYRMRVGATRHTVYVAPKERGRLTKRDKRRYARPNLGGLLMDRAMLPALQANEPKIAKRMEDLLTDVSMFWQKAA